MLPDDMTKGFSSMCFDCFRELGCELFADLADLEEQDLMELGMKKIEVTRRD